MDEQVQVLNEVADDVGTHINNGYLSRTLVWQSLCTQVWPSIHFPLATTMILTEELEEITKILYSQLLPSRGSKPSFPFGLLPCPSHFLQSHLTSPQVIDMQFIEQVKRVMVHGALQTHAGKYFNISLEAAGSTQSWNWHSNLRGKLQQLQVPPDILLGQSAMAILVDASHYTL
jgi:hypothetical protein